jgi:CheY-like chemotaxis protein
MHGMRRQGFDSPDSLNGIYAVVVDSDTDRRALTSAILRYGGALVTAAATPDAALTILQLLKPDVVVVDLSMESDGATVFIRGLRALKPDEGGMVTAIAVGEDGIDAALVRGRGFDAGVSRPLEPWQLCRAILSALGG